MARGSEAKALVIEKLKEAFGKDYIGEHSDKKIYVWAKDGYETVQIAIALTCPKNMIEAPAQTQSNNVDMTGVFNLKSAEPVSTEITPEEKENIANLLARLGL